MSKKKGDQVTRKGASSASYREESRPKLRGLFSKVENSHKCEKQSLFLWSLQHYHHSHITSLVGQSKQAYKAPHSSIEATLSSKKEEV